MLPVLIVDDDLPTQQLLLALMRRNGFESLLASNGAEAIRVLGARDFAIIILDLMMPGVSGADVIEFVEREKGHIPVILCTAAGPRQTESIHNRVVRAIIRKPFDIEHLSKLVSSLANGEPPR